MLILFFIFIKTVIFLDIRGQLLDQVKCLEQRTDIQVSILHEVNDFLKKRAELDLEYSKQLDKLVKSVMLKYKNEKQKLVFLTFKLFFI